jgi:hypothetical protein
MMFNFINATKYLEFDPIQKVLKASNLYNPEVVKPEESAPIVGYQSEEKYDQKEINRIKETIKYMESRGEGAKGEGQDYSFSQPSGIEAFGDALGAYQITEAKLRENSRRFLGKNITKDEFLNNPELQDKYIESQIKFLLDRGFKTNSLFSAHRGGWSNLSRNATMERNKKYQQYMNEAMEKYNSILEDEKE